MLARIVRAVDLMRFLLPKLLQVLNNFCSLEVQLFLQPFHSWMKSGSSAVLDPPSTRPITERFRARRKLATDTNGLLLLSKSGPILAVCTTLDRLVRELAVPGQQKTILSHH